MRKRIGLADMTRLIEIEKAVFGIEDAGELRVNDWTLCVGDRWVVSGGNGSGKSILAETLCACFSPDAGCITHILRLQIIAKAEKSVRFHRNSAEYLLN